MGSFFAPKSGFLGENDSFFLTFIKDVVLFLFIAIQGEQAEDEIANDLLQSENLEVLIKRYKKLAGRFIIVCHTNEGFFIIPDATASIHVTYTVQGNDLYVSSNPKIISDLNGWEESPLSKQIKSSAAETFPLPYDMSMYDEIKYVLPNHYLNCQNRKVIRYYPKDYEANIAIEKAAKISRELIHNIINGYNSRFKLSLPLTAGTDSRTILSFCKDIINEIPCYTFFHNSFTDDTPDISVPKKLCHKYDIKYKVLNDVDLPDSISQSFFNQLGSSTNPSEARNAWTYYNSELSNRIRLDGNISPLAKSSFGRDLPELLATSSYLVTKTHNYSKENKKAIKRWVDDTKPYLKQSSISRYDLFFWEHRAGKWTSNSYMNSDLITDSINPFNCRELIETWLRVPRKERTNTSLHKEIIRLNWPELLEFPINPNTKYSFLYQNSFLYYIAVRLKYWFRL